MKFHIFKVRWFYKREADKEWTPFMGYDSLRIELRYRHIWQTKWAAAANNSEDPASAAAAGNGGTQNQNTAGAGQPGRSRRSTSLNRNVHYETEPDPGVDTPVGNKAPPTGQPANYGGGTTATRGRHKSYRHYR